WRLARPVGSLRAWVASLVVYAAIPVPYNALARGSWGGLVLYAVSPWLLLRLARTSRLAPFAPTVHPADPPGPSMRRPRKALRSRADRRGDPTSNALVAAEPHRFRARRVDVSAEVLREVLAIGVVLAVVGAFMPFVVAVAGLVAVAWAAGSLVSARGRGNVRLLASVAGGIGLAFVLHLPWSFDLVRPGATWIAFAGIRSGGPDVLDAGDLLRFETGPFGATPLGWASLLAAALPVVIGKGWRYEWAVRAWFLALTGWGLVWTSQEGWLPVDLPPSEVLLAPVAAALALATALGVQAFEVDLPGYRFGWRQALSTAAGVAVVIGVLPLVPGVIDGRWQLPGAGLDRPLDAVLQHDGDADSRVLWVGDPDVIPVGSWSLDDGLAYATSVGSPSIAERWAGSDDGATGLLGRSLDLARRRRTTRLGALLAPMGVRYLVAPVRSAPAAFDGVVRSLPRSFTGTLAEQLDLERIESDSALVVYRNTTWVGTAMQLPDGSEPGDRFTDALQEDLASWRPALQRRSATERDGRVLRPGSLLLADASSSRWRLQSDGADVERPVAYGWANAFAVQDVGPVHVRYDTPTLRFLLCGLQVLLWLVALLLLRRTSGRGRPRRSRRPVRDRAAPDPVLPAADADPAPLEPVGVRVGS
ncbi:MAG: hypothetical protein WKF43_03190, partial [Acidimicrobiales bacterium]